MTTRQLLLGFIAASVAAVVLLSEPGDSQAGQMAAMAHAPALIGDTGLQSAPNLTGTPRAPAQTTSTATATSTATSTNTATATSAGTATNTPSATQTATALTATATITSTSTTASTTAATSTNTATNTPSATQTTSALTATATSAPTATPLGRPTPDSHEPDDSCTAAEAKGFLSIPGTITGLNFTPYTSTVTVDEDYFQVFLKPGFVYQFTTSVDPDVDTYMEVLGPDCLALNPPVSNDDVSSTDKGSQVSFMVSTQESYYIHIYENVPDFIPTGSYTLTLTSSSPTDTPTPTSTPLPTVTPTETTTPGPQPDAYEPDESCAEVDAKGSGGYISVGQTVSDLNFLPENYVPGISGTTDVDYFKVQLKAGHTYQATTAIQNPGIDTNMIVYPPMTTSSGTTTCNTGSTVGSNDDIAPGNLASSVTFTASTDGPYYIYITNKDPSDPAGKTYSLTVTEVIQPTATAGPSATPVPTNSGVDAFEPNYDFNHAAPIAEDVTYNDLNFVPWTGTGQNTDFFQLVVKPGLTYTCMTTIPQGSPADTNMILYDTGHNLIGGSDDIQPGVNMGSQVTFNTFGNTSYGTVFIEIGNVGTVPFAQASQYTYTLECFVVLPSTPTATPTRAAAFTPAPQSTAAVLPSATFPPKGFEPSDTPVPGSGFGTGLATATPVTSTVPSETQVPAGTQMIPFATASSTSPAPQTIGVVPLPSPTPGAGQPISIDVRAYYDDNGNGTYDPGEGIVGLSVRAYDSSATTLLASGVTDGNGFAHLDVTGTTGPVLVTAPLLGFSQVVTGPSSSIEIRIMPQPLPVPTPGGTPGS